MNRPMPPELLEQLSIHPNSPPGSDAHAPYEDPHKRQVDEEEHDQQSPADEASPPRPGT